MPANRRILLIDDDPIFMAVLEHVLLREGYEVVKATEGREASALIGALDPPPLLIISDIMLPFLDGYQLAARVRATAGWETIPVMMLSAKGQEQDIQKALENGADDYLVKPFQHGELLARIRHFLR